MTRLFTTDYFRGEHYPDYFKTRHWQQLKDQLIYSNPDAKCFICNRLDTLLIHHCKYDNLFNEELGRDVYILCFDCHTRTHFHRDGRKVPLAEEVLVKRMKLLKYTYHVRSFKLGSCINAIIDYIFFNYA